MARVLAVLIGIREPVDRWATCEDPDAIVELILKRVNIGCPDHSAKACDLDKFRGRDVRLGSEEMRDLWVNRGSPIT